MQDDELFSTHPHPPPSGRGYKKGACGPYAPQGAFPVPLLASGKTLCVSQDNFDFGSDVGETIKALTLWQPWAQAVAEGVKKWETRGWKTNYRGWVAIHAAARKMTHAQKELAEKWGMKEMPSAAVVAVARLTDCVLMTEENMAKMSEQERAWGDWQVGRWAWRLEDVRKLPVPMPATGAQGLWTLKNAAGLWKEIKTDLGRGI